MRPALSLLSQAILVAAVGVLLSVALYSEWFQVCCMDTSREAIGILIFPAMLVAMIIGGGIHSATKVDITIGLAIELLLLWGIILFLRMAWRKRTGKAIARKHDIGDCEHCRKQFGYYLIHNGFNNSAYAYCDTCGVTAILSAWKVPKSVQMVPYQNITSDVEPYLAPCQCGGVFRVGASARCPHCHQPLSAGRATDYIEPQAEGAKSGWRWQRNWKDSYCLIIEERVVYDVWK